MDGFYASDHFTDIQPIPHAFETLQKLKIEFDLHIVTSRQFAIQDLTLKWVDQHFPGIFSEVHFGNHYSREGKVRSKPEICRDIGAVLLIDDSLQYAMHCYKADIPVLLFGEYAWNQKHSVCNTIFENCPITIESYDAATHTIAKKISNPNTIYRTHDWRDVPEAINFLLKARDSLSVAAVQLCAVNNKLINLRTTERLVAQAVRECSGVLHMVCLPECCAFVGESGLQTIAAAEPIDPSTAFPTSKCSFSVSARVSEEISDDEVQREADYDGVSDIHYVAGLCEVAHRHKVWLSVGGFPEKRSEYSSDTGPCISNTHFLISPYGKIASPLYRKIHLFDAPLVGLEESKTTGK